VKLIHKNGLNQLNEKNIDEGALDWLQTGLDIAGIVPGVGEAADGINAIISLGRGNPFEAVLSAISMIPGAGDLVGKSGKLVLKVFGPAMDMIKSGKKFEDIINKIGPGNIKKIAPAIESIKSVIAKYGPSLKGLFKAIKSKDLEAVEKFSNFKVPGIAREKAASILEKAADSLPDTDINSVIAFLSKIDISDKLFGRGDEDSSDEEQLDNLLQQTESIYMANCLLGPTIYGSSYINETLAILAKDIKLILK